jgi:hypothetical protein
VPILGAAVCLLLIATSIVGKGANLKAPLIAGGIIAVIMVLFLILRPKTGVVMEEEDTES